MDAFPTQFLRSVVLKRDSVTGFEAYPFDIPAVRNLTELSFHPAVTYLVGDNGTGKSTLLEALAVSSGFNPEGGTINFRFSTRASHSCLHQHLRIVKGIQRPKTGFFLRAESFFNVATEIENLGGNIVDAYGGIPLHEMSHGESFWMLLAERFHGNGLYLLDEPEAALSPTRQLAVLARIHHLVQQGSQFIIVTHSPILMAYPNARIYLFSDGSIEETNYENTEHFQVTRSFLNRRESALKELFDNATPQTTMEFE